MKSELASFLSALILLLCAAAAEELLPKPGGIGLPLLLVATLFRTRRHSIFPVILFALAAGAFEDALSNLPGMTSVSFFLLSALVMRVPAVPFWNLLLSYPLYQLWIELWVSSPEGGVFNRILLAIPAGLVAIALAAVADRFRVRGGASSDSDSDRWRS